MKNIVISKSAETEAVTAEQLDKINLFTRRSLTSEEVYVFSIILCDNDIDRDGEAFTNDSLETLGELFVGKTGLFDHNPKAENQSARIFETKLEWQDNLNSLGEQYCCLKAWAYMVRCDKTSDLILEIEAGIKKEVSVGCSVESIECSICGANQKNEQCNHKKGEVYDGKICCHLLINPTDAYEWSFVAVPAQKNAGVTRKNMSEGFESLGDFLGGEDVVLSKSALSALKSQISLLEKLADAGRNYITQLRQDVVKFAALAQPDINCKTIANISEKLEISELLQLKHAFEASAAEKYPVMPQLCKSQIPQEKSASDVQFKI